MDLQTENTDILQTIVAHKQQEVDEWMRFMPPRQLMAKVEERMAKEEQPPASMRQALLQSGTGIIAEFKRKSPSKGWIKREGRAGVIPMAYQQAGATALSILTDNHFFGGYDEFISEARASGVTLPILYKNFIISEYQLLQARFCGASAVLLIAADLLKDVAERSSTWPTSWAWRCCWRCTVRTSSITPTWNPTCMASTTATSALS